MAVSCSVGCGSASWNVEPSSVDLIGHGEDGVRIDEPVLERSGERDQLEDRTRLVELGHRSVVRGLVDASLGPIGITPPAVPWRRARWRDAGAFGWVDTRLAMERI